jgi:hypothetical protein
VEIKHTNSQQLNLRVASLESISETTNASLVSLETLINESHNLSEVKTSTPAKNNPLPALQVEHDEDGDDEEEDCVELTARKSTLVSPPPKRQKASIPDWIPPTIENIPGAKVYAASIPEC